MLIPEHMWAASLKKFMHGMGLEVLIISTDAFRNMAEMHASVLCIIKHMCLHMHPCQYIMNGLKSMHLSS